MVTYLTCGPKWPHDLGKSFYCPSGHIGIRLVPQLHGLKGQSLFSFWLSASPPYWWGEFSSHCGCSGWVMVWLLWSLGAACLESDFRLGVVNTVDMVRVNDHRPGIQEQDCSEGSGCLSDKCGPGPGSDVSNSPEWPPCNCVVMAARVWEIAVGLLGEWRGFSEGLSWWLVQVCGVWSQGPS